MSDKFIFRSTVVDAALAVMRCDYCRAHAPAGDQPQPGWVGSRYVPDRGVVVILQNPGPSHSPEHDAPVQQLLKDFTSCPSVETYESLMQYVFADMAGENGWPQWRKWAHPVSKLLLEPRDRERLAWMNVVKYRTLGMSPDSVATNHGVQQHLRNELLSVLRPKAVVAIGNDARDALAFLTLPGKTMREYLKLQGASSEEAKSIGQKLRDAGADI